MGSTSVPFARSLPQQATCDELAKGDLVALFQLKTQDPGPDWLAIREPETERRRLKLRDTVPSCTA